MDLAIDITVSINNIKDWLDMMTVTANTYDAFGRLIRTRLSPGTRRISLAI